MSVSVLEPITPYPWQLESAGRLAEIIRARGAAIDASDTGIGKTVVALEVVRRLGDPPTLVVCPKSVIPSWERTAARMGVSVDVVNYEKLVRGRTPYGFFEYGGGTVRWWQWAPEVRFVIFDEVHRCKARSSLASRVLRACRRFNKWVLGLSATIAESPLDMYALGYVLRLHDGSDKPTLKYPKKTSFASWAMRYGARPGVWSWLEWTPSDERRKEFMRELHRALFPDCGVRIRYSDLPPEWVPQTRIIPELVSLDDTDEQKLNEIYLEVARLFQSDEPPMVQTLRLRQQAELLKVPAMVEMTQDGLANGHSVVCFVNFRETAWKLAAALDTEAVIDGDQVGERGARARQAIVDKFQSGVIRLVICNIQAGGVGLDLHDTIGDHPRLALISPPWSAIQLRQALGRAARTGQKSLSVQKILFVEDTIEEKVYARVQRKLTALDTLQDGDLTPVEDPAILSKSHASTSSV